MITEDMISILIFPIILLQVNIIMYIGMLATHTHTFVHYGCKHCMYNVQLRCSVILLAKQINMHMNICECLFQMYSNTSRKNKELKVESLWQLCSVPVCVNTAMAGGWRGGEEANLHVDK